MDSCKSPAEPSTSSALDEESTSASSPSSRIGEGKEKMAQDHAATANMESVLIEKEASALGDKKTKKKRHDKEKKGSRERERSDEETSEKDESQRLQKTGEDIVTAVSPQLIADVSTAEDLGDSNTETIVVNDSRGHDESSGERRSKHQKSTRKSRNATNDGEVTSPPTSPIASNRKDRHRDVKSKEKRKRSASSDKKRSNSDTESSTDEAVLQSYLHKYVKFSHLSVITTTK